MDRQILEEGLLENVYDALHLLDSVIMDERDPHYTISSIKLRLKMVDKRVRVEMSPADTNLSVKNNGPTITLLVCTNNRSESLTPPFLSKTSTIF